MGVRKWKSTKRAPEERLREAHSFSGVLRTSSWVSDKGHNFSGPLDRVGWSWVFLFKASSWGTVLDEPGLGQVHTSSRQSPGDALKYYVWSYIYKLHFLYRQIYTSSRAQLNSGTFIVPSHWGWSLFLFVFFLCLH